MYVFIKTEPGLFTVGHYDPENIFVPNSDHSDQKEAEAKVHYLNGGTEPKPKKKEGVREYHVVWEIQLDAISKTGAAKAAKGIMLNTFSEATVFYVSPDNIKIIPEGECCALIDLNNPLSEEPYHG